VERRHRLHQIPLQVFLGRPRKNRNTFFVESMIVVPI
jgi:hypothetical protein